jgi:hypothetical protein
MEKYLVKRKQKGRRSRTKAPGMRKNPRELILLFLHEETKPDIIMTHSSGASFEPGEPIIMDARQTIKACRAAPPSTVIAIHMETFEFDTVSRKDLHELVEAEGIKAGQLRIPLDGETLLL